MDILLVLGDVPVRAYTPLLEELMGRKSLDLQIRYVPERFAETIDPSQEKLQVNAIVAEVWSLEQVQEARLEGVEAFDRKMEAILDTGGTSWREWLMTHVIASVQLSPNRPDISHRIRWAPIGEQLSYAGGLDYSIYPDGMFMCHLGEPGTKRQLKDEVAWRLKNRRAYLASLQ